MSKRILALSSITGLLVFSFVNYQNFISPVTEQNTGYLNSTRPLIEDDIKSNQGLFVDAIQNKLCDDVGIDAKGNLVANFQPLAQGVPRCLDLFQKNATFAKIISFNASPATELSLGDSKEKEINIKFDSEVEIFFNNSYESLNALNLNKVGQLRKSLNSFYSLELSNAALPLHVDNTLSRNFNRSYISADKPIADIEDYSQLSHEDSSSAAYRKFADKVLTEDSLKLVKTALANGSLIRTTIEVYDNFKAFPSGQMVPANPNCSFIYALPDQVDLEIYDDYKNCDNTTKGQTHHVVIVGYDDTIEAFKVMNSWGAGWGQGGMIWISYKLFQDSHFSSNAFIGRITKNSVANCSNLPENSLFCEGDDAELDSNSLFSTYVASCQSNSIKCEYTCKKNHEHKDGACVRIPGTCDDNFTFNPATKSCEPSPSPAPNASEAANAPPSEAPQAPKATCSVRFQKESESFSVITKITEGQSIQCKLTPTSEAESLTCRDSDWLNEQLLNVSNDLKCFK
jgi:hypothetical protein